MVRFGNNVGGTYFLELEYLIGEEHGFLKKLVDGLTTLCHC